MCPKVPLQKVLTCHCQLAQYVLHEVPKGGTGTEVMTINPNETNGLIDGAAYHEEVDYSILYTLAMVKDEGGRISRVRLLTERWPAGRMADVSYIHATLPSGKIVPVQVGASSTFLWKMKGEFIEWAKREGVFAKSIGLLDEANWSVMY